MSIERKNIVKGLRKLKAIMIISAFIAFFFGLLTTRDIVHIPFYDFAQLLPEHFFPLPDNFWQGSIKGFLVYNLSAFLTFFSISFGFVYFFYSKFIYDHDGEEVFKRGSQKVEGDNLKSIIEKDMIKKGDKPYVYLSQAKIPIPFKETVRNFLFLGKVGSGKTQGIFNLIFGLYKKGKKISKGIIDYNPTMIIYDRKPDFTQLLYRRGTGKDFLFDPRDKDCLRWNIFDDLLTKNGAIDETMIDFFAKSLCPADPDSKSSHFQEQAQAVFKAVLVKVAGMKKPNNKILIDFLQANGEGTQLRNVLIVDSNVKLYGLQSSVLNSLTLGQGGLDNQGNSVMSSLNKSFRGICRREFYYEEGDFSVRDFINSIDSNPDRRLFIVNTKEMAGAYTTYFSLFINLFFKIGTTLSQPSDRRIFCLFDEIQSLGSDGNHELGKQLISELCNFMAESRSYGYSVAVATQSLPQLERLIKKEGTRELFQHLSNKFLFQYNEPEGSEWLSKYLNEQEIDRVKESYTQSGDTDINKDRFQESEEEKLKRIVLPSEFNTLKPLEAFAVVGEHPTAKIQFLYRLPPKICDNLIEKPLPFFDQDTIVSMRRFYKNQSKEEQLRESLRMAQEIRDIKESIKEELQ